MMVVILIALAVLLVAWWVLLPVVSPSSTAEVEPEWGAADLPEENLRVQQIIDLEYDYRTGKLSREEYLQQKQEILRS